MDNFAKLLYASVLLYWISLFVTKCALLFFYRRVFLFNSKSFRNSLYAIAVFNAACFVAVFFVFTFQCTPVSFAWNKKIKGGKCIDFNTLCVSTAVIAIMTDVAILTLPMPMIWNLKIDKWRKLAISGVFLLGGFVVVSSIIRIPQLTKLDFSDPSCEQAPSQPQQCPDWLLTKLDTDVGAATWSTVEASIAIVSANLPTFAPLFRGPGSIASWAASRMSSAGQSRGHGSSKQSGNSSHVSANRQNSEYTDGSGSNFQEEKESAVVPSVVTDIRSEEAKQMAASGIEVKKDVEWN